MEYSKQDIQNFNNERKLNILKGFKEVDEILEKGKSGTYADTPENRKLGRVGQKYGKDSSENDSKGKDSDKKVEENTKDSEEDEERKNILAGAADYAKKTSVKQLEKFISKSDDEDMINIAKKELESRNKQS